MKANVKRVVYSNNTTGYTIVSMTTQETKNMPEDIAVYKGTATFTAVGVNIPLSGSELEVEGEWVVNPKYGKQLCIMSCKEIIPESKSGIIAYLASGLFTGIGEKTAESIYQALGDKTLQKIKSNYKCLLQIRGITEERAKKVFERLNQSEAISGLTMFLAPFGISLAKCTAIYKKFGANSVNRLKNDPYEICKIKGFGFLTADIIATKINSSLKSESRIKACIRYVLDEASTSGHLYYPPTELCQKAYQLLNKNQDEEIISLKSIKLVLIDMGNEKEIVLENNEKVYSLKAFEAEYGSAKSIAALISFPVLKKRDVAGEIDEIQAKHGISLDKLQVQGIKNCFLNNISVITGGPGTGKTTILRVITEIVGSDIVLMAPTGRAAQRMSEICKITASTIHKVLGIMGTDENFRTHSLIDAKFVIIDEASMIDQHLAEILIKSIGLGTRVLIVGDIEQLPSVGPGNFLRELINSNQVPVTFLKKVYRQSVDSYIASNALKIRKGELKLDYGKDFAFYELSENEAVMKKVEEVFFDEIKSHSLDNVQILTPSRDKGQVCAKTINAKIQERLNPHSETKPELVYGQRIFRLDDKVMQIKNSMEVSNGEVGIVKSITKADGNVSVIVEFSGKRLISYEREALGLIRHAYAMTIHKSQGSEYEVVIITILKSNYIMLKRNLIYTAITRGKGKVIIIGQQEALNIAIRTNDIDKRNTAFASRINAEIEKKSSKKSEKLADKEEQLSFAVK